jgi:hypothetical protein
MLTPGRAKDGSGYPRGLKGEEIPLSGRIVAIADVFDALTSERPYKKVWTVEQATDLITDGAGKHFDPTLVPLFLERLPDVLEVKERYAESKAAPGLGQSVRRAYEYLQWQRASPTGPSNVIGRMQPTVRPSANRPWCRERR